MTVDTSHMTPAADLIGEDEVETKEIRTLVGQAREFVGGFDWCKSIEEIYSGIAVPGVIGVFLMRIIPEGENVDHEIWAIVGDLPPAYLVTDNAPNAVRAVEVYVDLMQEWIDAVKGGRAVEDLIPVNAPPSEEAARILQSRLDFLMKRIVATYRDEID